MLSFLLWMEKVKTAPFGNDDFHQKMLVRSAISRLANWSRATFPGLVGAEPARIAAVQD